MSGIWVNLLVQIIAGVAGGNVAGAVKDINLGMVGNTIAGGVGGAIGGQLLTALLPMLAGGPTDVGPLLSQIAGGGVAGAVLTAIVGFIVNYMGGSRPATS